ncbi:tRNA-splicing ligase RtcB [Sarcoptes scabiei]|nr:tRNA-splicing ligase RtcB [Sarcoptes scabiei]
MDKAQVNKKHSKKRQSKEVQRIIKGKSVNPKAFAIQSAVKAERKFRHKQDVIAKREKLPQIDRTPLRPAPFVVSVVGPPKVGKSTIIRGLIRHYTRQNVSKISGPVTVVCNKNLRITLLECNNDINCMIDIAKISDLVLLAIDASFGFEMETFEFLNICQAHGFPRILGVLTHLDVIKNSKKINRVKKQLKHRFWTEIYAGVKLFYLSKLIHNEYLRNEMHNLARFISVIKIRPLEWTSSHPYLLVDRIEDVTSPELIKTNDKCDRRVCLFGWSRGANFKPKQAVHIPGCGDFVIDSINFIPDPCPLPERENEKRRRSLKEKDKCIYAPMSGVGGIIFDKDAIYIDLGGSHSSKDAQSNIVTKINEIGKPLNKFNEDSDLKIFSEAIAKNNEPYLRRKVVFTDENSDDDSENDHENVGDDYSANEDSVDEDENALDSSTEKEILEFDSSDDEDIDEENLDTNDRKKRELYKIKWKNDILKKAQESFYQRYERTENIQRLVYGECKESEAKSEMRFTVNSIECSKFPDEMLIDFSQDSEMQLIRDSFVTGKWDENEDAQTLLENDRKLLDQLHDTDDNACDEKFCDEDFEDLENPTSKSDEFEDEVSTKNDEEILKTKKLLKKQQFNEEYDNLKSSDVLMDKEKTFIDFEREKAQKQTEINRKEFEHLPLEQRVQYEGFQAGLYLRIEINGVPCELVNNFDPSYPIIVGGHQHCETDIGFVRARIKKHRWYNKILKNKDPLIISMGWRRFQTQAFFSIEDHNGRNRMLKYTPQHMHCLATFWGPITPQNTGFVAFQSISERTSNFRIAATGVVLDLDKGTQIVKKLKLIGHPLKVYKKTAFISNMFTSALEVTKFEGAAIRTVSGIRGQIKKPIRTPEGAFRATFEDKISSKDIVFLRSWVDVPISKFYATVTSLLLPVDKKSQWLGMKTAGQLRYERGLSVPNDPNSHYQISQRKEYHFKPMIIPNKLQEELPFRSKPKLMPKKFNKVSRVAVIKDSHQRRSDNLIKRLRLAYREQTAQDRLVMQKRAQEHRKKMSEIEKNREARIKEKKKFIMRKMGKSN